DSASLLKPTCRRPRSRLLDPLAQSRLLTASRREFQRELSDNQGFTSSSQTNSIGTVDIALTRRNTSCMRGEFKKSFTSLTSAALTSPTTCTRLRSSMPRARRQRPTGGGGLALNSVIHSLKS